MSEEAKRYVVDRSRFPWVLRDPQRKLLKEIPMSDLVKTSDGIYPEAHKISGWKCTSCDHLFKDSFELVSLYECPECGTLFTREASYTGDGHQCPEDHKFSSKNSNEGCPECNEGECEETDLYECPECDELFEDADELVEHYNGEHQNV